MTKTNAPEHLSDFIDAYHAGDQPTPQDDLDVLAGDVMALAQTAHMDETVADALGKHFDTPASESAANNGTVLRFPTQGRRLVAAMGLMLLGGLLLLVTPQGRSFASEMLTLLFPRETNATRTIRYVDYDESDISTYETVEAFNQAVDFDLRVPTHMERNRDLTRIDYLASRNVAVMNYDGARIQQQPLADTDKGLLWHAFEPYSIGPDAELTDVELADGNNAQFVMGMWVEGEEEGYTWNPTFTFAHLRWQDATHVYEIRYNARTSNEESAIRQIKRIADSMVTDE